MAGGTRATHFRPTLKDVPGFGVARLRRENSSPRPVDLGISNSARPIGQANCVGALPALWIAGFRTERRSIRAELKALATTMGKIFKVRANERIRKNLSTSIHEALDSLTVFRFDAGEGEPSPPSGAVPSRNSGDRKTIRRAQSAGLFETAGPKRDWYASMGRPALPVAFASLIWLITNTSSTVSSAIDAG